MVLHTDVNVTEGSEALAECINIGLVGLDLIALGVLRAALLLSMETEVLKQNDLATGSLVHGLLSLGTNAVIDESDVLAEKLLKHRNNGLQAILGVDLAIRAAQVRHEHDGLGPIVDSILDGGQGTDDTLGVGNVLVIIKGDIEVNLFQPAVRNCE